MRCSTLLTLLASVPTLLALSTPSLYPRSRSYIRRQVDTNSTYCPGTPAPESVQRQIFYAFVNELYIEKDVIGAFDKYIAVNLTEHDPFDEQGRAANEIKLSNIVPFVDFTVLRENFDNNIGFVHLRYDIPGAEPTALADIYRMDGTCIVEHWDVTQARPANATNPIAMF